MNYCIYVLLKTLEHTTKARKGFLTSMPSFLLVQPRQGSIMSAGHSLVLRSCLTSR